MRVILLSWLFMFALASLPVLAQAPITLDFETYPGPDGRLGTVDDITSPACGGGTIGICAPIGDAYAAAGITFASGTLAQGSFFPGSLATNHFVSSSPPDVRFSFPVYGVSVTSYSNWSAVLYAFDAAGALIATRTLVNPTAGAGFFLGTLSVSTSTPIARFTVLEASCTVGGPFCSQILNLDDFVLTTAPPPPTAVGTPTPVAVPASSTWSLLLLSLAIATFAARRLRRPSPRGGSRVTH
jgi:hypothetical protein